MAEPVLRLEGVVKDYGEAVRTRVLHGLDLTVQAGEFTALIGWGLASFFQRAVKNPYGDSLFPVLLTPRLFVTAAAVALVTGLLSAWLPARHAARLDPATVIRNG